MFKSPLERVLAFVIVAAILPRAVHAQGFNVDVNAAAGVPTSSYGAASGQAGFWNSLPAAASTAPTALKDLSGATTAVTLAIAPGSSGYNGLGAWNWNNPLTLADDQALMDDILDVGGGFGGGIVSGLTVTLSGLTAGTYDVYCYCMAPDNYLPGDGNFAWNTLVTVVGATGGQQTVGALAWSVGSSSFLCVKPPTQRTASQNSGGTGWLCDGAFALDWNAFQLGNLGGLGQPWTVGAKVYVQAWHRDPPAVKTTNLSDALELTYLP